MTDDITIPAEALEAAARAICLHERAHDKDWPDYLGHARAACIAMLKNWLGLSVALPSDWYEYELYPKSLILPIQEQKP